MQQPERSTGTQVESQFRTRSAHFGDTDFGLFPKKFAGYYNIGMSNSPSRRMSRLHARRFKLPTKGSKMNPMNNGGLPAGPQVRTLVQILLGTDGRLYVNVQGEINRAILNMMVTTGHQDLLSQLAKAEQQAKDGIEVAPPGSQVQRNPKAE
jgi:hypothetical protein